ncbi:MAG TPA: hypothetical protein VFA19_04430 [Gaiellaceae bacterium]|nr:hypothetical protein [Gaiellaceae bacterium]
MDFVVRDFNGADQLFQGSAAGEWSDLERLLSDLTLHLQPSGQAGIAGRPIFDPKGTNAALTQAARALGWVGVPVPSELTMFGVDWDAGKGTTLAEWQFSNYPFLWNNVIRSQAVVSGRVVLAGVGTTEGLVVVTKSGVIPASNSTLYYEQAEAQLDSVMTKGAFSLPIRLVGLTLPDAEELDAVWSIYPSRYARAHTTRRTVRIAISRSRRPSRYGYRAARFTVAD